MENKLDYRELDLGDNVVLVSGAGGTIGSGIIGRIRASRIIACDLSEYAIYRLRREYGDRFEYVVGDLSDFKFVNWLYNRHRWTYVVNCAAYKHVDLMESGDNIYSAIKNNIGILLNLIMNADEYHGFIHISSDKAVNPVNNMGKTKAYCERTISNLAWHYSGCGFKIVRFGNVYASSGSFIETLDYQVSNNLPITVTDVGMMRYFLSIDDACSLICRAGGMADTGTYILDMGREVSIMDIVSRKNTGGLPVEIIGLRTGEKLHEQLVGDNERLLPTGDSLINRVAFGGYNTAMGRNIIDMTTVIRGTMDVERAIKLLGEIGE